MDGKKAIDTHLEVELEIELSDDQVDELYDSLYKAEEKTDVECTSDRKYGKYLLGCWSIGEPKRSAISKRRPKYGKI